MTAIAVPPTLYYHHCIGVHKAKEPWGISEPVGIAVGPNDRIYIISRSDAWHEKAARVTVVDLDAGNPMQFSSFGSEPGQLVAPTAIAIGPDGRVYVADDYTHAISLFEADGEFVARWGSRGDAPDRFDGPSGLTVDADGMLWVVDRGHARVMRFTPEGRLLSSFGRFGTGLGELNHPWGIALGDDGTLWVADWRNDRVACYTPAGKLVRTIGDGVMPKLSRPATVLAAADGTVFIADRGTDSVVALTSRGELLARLIGDATLSSWAEKYLADTKITRERRAGGALYEQEKRFWRPSALALTASGMLLVADTARHRIQVYAYAHV
jgi:sugar lactone lactonase YvrE